MRGSKLVSELLRSKQPSIRWRVRVRVLRESRRSPTVLRLEQSIRRSDVVRQLMSHWNAPFRPGTSRSVYYCWQGIHWGLASLADIGYPMGEPGLGPFVDRALGLWLGPHYFRSFSVSTSGESYRQRGVPVIRGRARRCASQQGAALYYATQLGFSDSRSTQLAGLRLRWQWPDGGWNCDKHPEADSSSFMETLWPMRGLAAYAARVKDPDARRAAHRAATVFLERKMFRRKANGEPMAREFARLHYPLYWHYDILGGLKGIAEVGKLDDARCSEALDWLESRELPQGGWPADERHYRVSSRFRPGSEFVDWGGIDRGRRNDWVTSDALFALGEAGRLNL